MLGMKRTLYLVCCVTMGVGGSWLSGLIEGTDGWDHQTGPQSKSTEGEGLTTPFTGEESELQQ